MELKVHLNFDGDCEEAFDTYKNLFDGKIEFLFRKGDEKGVEVAEADKNKISHIILKTEKFSLQGEDTGAGEPTITGTNKLVLVFTDIKKVKEVFAKLSEGGTIVAPLEKTFFTEAMGELIDKFGIRWIIMMSDDDYTG